MKRIITLSILFIASTCFAQNYTVVKLPYTNGTPVQINITAGEKKNVAVAENRASPGASSLSSVVGTRALSNVRQHGNCESGLSIESVKGDGKVIKLDDGSMWEVDDVATVDSSLWLPTSEVLLCGNKMINTDDKESAEVTLVAPARGASSETTNSSTSGYVIEASADDETFVINGEVFKAKTYCFNLDKGDRVKFIKGSPLGACASAQLLDLRTGDVCEVWCE